MSKQQNESGLTMLPGQLEPVMVGRRLFLRYAGAFAAGGALLASCKDDNDNPVTVPSTVDLGSGDVGILNYAYALEQLEAAFYEQVIATPYGGMTDAEKTLLTDIRDHEVIHRDFFKAALGANAISALTPNFSAVNFADRASVLNSAKAFEDLGVAAYNGAGNLIKDANYLVLAGKIVSVEARHAAAIRDLLSPKSALFAGDDIVNPTTGLDGAAKPATVLPIAQPFVKTPLTGANLPTA
ncbi:ferritin-like domain-containing protein [Spirosoma taeanense]|uniref:Ferritin-like domain-containing protein n=1 Tax=Spirosoma taeanense TaxID=2735870 RepID=A0A6M5YB27_9BACT|nr:ferritin-like domain-containing protein [Spirosoma taeanense]QJW91368.1 ferritin-like domain-containing protein [Spirosoma taeanense]